MYIINWVHMPLHTPGCAVIEAQLLDNGVALVDVLIDAHGTVIGRLLDKNGHTLMLTHEECLKVIGLLNPPAHVMSKRTEIGDTGIFRMPALARWLSVVFPHGRHEHVAEYA